MKPYLRERNLKGARFKVDNHPPKGYVNWWEYEMEKNTVTRSFIKQQLKKQSYG